MNTKDISNMEFGKLKVVSFYHVKGTNAYWKCLCICGAERVVRGSSLINGLCKSCPSCANLKHGYNVGGKPSKEYRAWIGIKSRCNNPNKKYYEHYGGRGIKICPKWENSFEEFLNDMGFAPSAKHSIERVENDGDYEPNNCKWGTTTEQSNNKRNNINISLQGKTQSLKRWCVELNLNYRRIHQRIHLLGWNPEVALKHKSFSR